MTSEGAKQPSLFGDVAEHSRYGAIDATLPEITRCLKCGLCRAVCPILEEVHDESGSARGRIAMIEDLREAKLGMSPVLIDRLSKCLNCKACMEACPSGIKVDEIVLAARAEIFKQGHFPFIKKFIFRNLLKRGRLVPPVSKTLAFIERKVLKCLPPSSPYRVLLPLVKLDKQRVLPVFAEQALMEDLGEVVSPQGKPRMRVGLFVGCATNLIYTKVGRDVVRVLLGEGIEIVIPRGQGCCGMPVYSAGDRETGLALAKANIQAFRKHKVDAIVTACASCGVALKQDYEKILGLGAGELGARVYDFGEFLAEHGRLQFDAGARDRLKVTYHYPCHLSRGQGIKEAPRKLLQAIPYVDFCEMEQADRCCGGAGTFSLSHYDLAKAIGRKKVNFIVASGAQVVATSCPSCMMQLEDMLGRNRLPQRVVHLAELLAPCYPPLEQP
ncbi:MAG TPA: (Fe-S)-binding protein [bacterium]|nr:(Fe-S)-binding protein [bacterium]